MNTQLIDYIASIMGLCMLVAMWHACWKPYALARLRHDLFVTRAALFDKAQEGEDGLSLTCPFYRNLREDLNGMLRYCHRISLMELIIHSCFQRKETRQQTIENRLEKALLNEDQLRVLKDVNHRQFTALQRYLIQSSPLLWLVLVAMICIVLPYSLLRGVRNRLFDKATQPWTRRLVAQAEFNAGQKCLSGDELCMA